MYSDTAKRDAHHVRDMDGYKVRAGGHDSRNYMEFKRFLELFMSLSGTRCSKRAKPFLNNTQISRIRKWRQSATF